MILPGIRCKNSDAGFSDYNGPAENNNRRAQAEHNRWQAERIYIFNKARNLREKIGRQVVDLEAEQILHLRQRDQNGNTIREADDDGDRHKTYQRPDVQQAPMT